MPTDLEQRVRVALVAILDANTAVKAATGRSSGVQVVEFGQWLYAEPPIPLLVYDLVAWDKGTGRITLALTAVAKTAATARALLNAGSAALTYTAFAAHTLDVARWEGGRSSVLLGESSDRLLTREGEPDLYQADETLDLLLLTAPD